MPKSREMSTLELKIPPLLLVLIAAGAMWAISIVAPAFAWQLFYRQLAAVFLFLAGFLVTVLGVLAFRQAQTTVNPTTPNATSALVSAGIYNLSRNPMYLGFLLALAGWALFVANALSLVVLPVFVAYMNRFQIIPEEKALQAMFGHEFTSYLQRVRRWL